MAAGTAESSAATHALALPSSISVDSRGDSEHHGVVALVAVPGSNRPMEPVDIKAYVARCVQTLRRRGMRRTRALELVIEEMAGADRPVTLQELAAKPVLARQCDQATVYRLVIKLLEQGLVRKLGLHERSAYFAPLIPGEHHDYLVCTECGSIKSIDMSCPVKKLEKDVMKSSGFTRVYHELEFYGVCPSCV